MQVDYNYTLTPVKSTDIVPVWYMNWETFTGLYASTEKPVVFEEKEGDRFLAYMSIEELQDLAERVDATASFDSVQFCYEVLVGSKTNQSE